MGETKALTLGEDCIFGIHAKDSLVLLTSP